METLLFREVNRCPETEKSDSSKETSQNPSSTNISSRCVVYGRVLVYRIAQKKNAYYWALTRDVVWAAISVRGIIGPYFFHADGNFFSVNQYTYQTCVKWFVSELKKRRRFKWAVFMQDWATPHTALSTREYLRQTFHGRVIGKHFYKPWPPYSPDLTPADFYL